jgi:uncharacterized protein YbjT (DUF2867 family)
MPSSNSFWNPGRFVQTLAYFEALPVVGDLQRLFRALTQPGAAVMTQPHSLPHSSTAVILVAGATGGVGRRVVKLLQAQGHTVRALVRDLQRAREMLGADIELIDADITIAETLTPAVVENIRAVICCTGVRVQPVEGDTPDRAKYYQGIKFYLPEVVGDTPENVDFNGIQNLLQAIAPALQAPPETTLFDFTNPALNIQEVWGALDDVVMGGVSESGIQAGEGAAVFTGNVSIANSGGFASIRTRNLEPAINLATAAGIRLRVRGDGNRYKFLLRSETGWDSIAYSHSFDTIADEWITVDIPFDGLIPVFRAKTVPNAKLDPSQIRSLQVMLSKFEYNGTLNPHFTPGSFRLEIATIAAYPSPLPQFVLVSSAGVTRPGRPGINLDEEPPAVRLNDQLGGILTWKLRGEDLVRQSGIPYTIVRPCALTEESGGNQLVFAQGDTLKGKISRNDAAALCVAALTQPAAVNVTFEVNASETSGANDWSALFAQLQADRA